MSHIPVMPDEVLAALQARDGETYVDGTFGGGGHSRAILKAANCHLIALDRDPEHKAASEGSWGGIRAAISLYRDAIFEIG